MSRLIEYDELQSFGYNPGQKRDKGGKFAPMGGLGTAGTRGNAIGRLRPGADKREGGSASAAKGDWKPEPKLGSSGYGTLQMPNGETMKARTHRATGRLQVYNPDLHGGMWRDVHEQLEEKAAALKTPKSLSEAYGSKWLDHGPGQDAKTYLENRQHLSLIDPKIHALLADKGVAVSFGNGDVTEHAMAKNLSGIQPRGWESDATWDIVPGAYQSGSSTVIVGSGEHARNHGSVSIAIHESMHAVQDMLFETDHTRELDRIHRKHYDSLRPYQQQGGPAGSAGAKELWAEGAARHLLGHNMSEFGGSDMSRFVDQTLQSLVENRDWTV